MKRLLLGLLCALSVLAAAQSQADPPPHPALPVTGLPLQATVNGAQGDYFRLQKKIYRWNDKTHFVLVYISSADFLNDWHPENVQIVRNAFTEWQQALENRLMFVFVKDPAQADVIVSWWNTTQPGIEKGACGLNQLHTWGKYISENDIYLSLHSAQGRVWASDEIYATALHEIGHMAGIQEHSDNVADIMAPTESNARHLTARDIATMKRIYATQPDYTNPPGYHLARFEDFKKTQKGKRLWIPIIIPI
jgi:hypothetical protein